jgi:hypothetical protein
VKKTLISDMQSNAIHDSDKNKYGKVHAVLFSYFHRLTGPRCIIEYPPNQINDQIRDDIALIMDQVAEPKIFTHKSSEITAINNFFEVPSKWARGGKERVMISILFIENVSSDVEKVLKPFLQDFGKQVMSTDGIFKGFYNAEEFDFTSSNAQPILVMKNELKSWVTRLFANTQSGLIDDWVTRQLPEFSLLPDEQIPLIQRFIKPEGLQILESISHGAKTRDDLSNVTKKSHLPIAGTIPLLVSLDLITEGSELVITNRGKKVLNSKIIIPEHPLKETEPYFWQEVFGEKGIHVLFAIRDGETRKELEEKYEDLKTILKLLRNYHLIVEEPELALTPYAQKFLKFIDQMNSFD